MMPNNPLGDQLVHASIALCVVATVAVILRFIARWKSKADFGRDDIMIAICLIPHVAMVVLNYLGLSASISLRELRLNIKQLFIKEGSDYHLQHYLPRRYLFS